jgi:hypothetical protein
MSSPLSFEHLADIRQGARRDVNGSVPPPLEQWFVAASRRR